MNQSDNPICEIEVTMGLRIIDLYFIVIAMYWIRRPNPKGIPPFRIRVISRLDGQRIRIINS